MFVTSKLGIIGKIKKIFAYIVLASFSHSFKKLIFFNA